MINQRWIYIKRPQTAISMEHYELKEEPLSEQLAESEVLIENRFVSVDPYMRIQQSASRTWEAPHTLNSLQQSGVVSQVVKSRRKNFQEGDWVSAYTGW